MGQKDNLIARAAELKVEVPEDATIAVLKELIAEKERGDLIARAAELDIAHPEDATVANLKQLIAEKEGGAPQEPMITVVGPMQGRRRAGRRFTPEPVSIPVSDLEDGELEALRNDPLLIVSAT